MPLHVYRVCRAIYARLDGYGAARSGGRWNSPGRRVVYMAQSAALAVLENLVHLSRQDFPAGFVIAGALIPEAVKILRESYVRLAAGIPGTATQHIGDYWIDNNLLAVLQVPSFVVPNESNYLLNPKHSDFRRVVVERPLKFDFDTRLFG